MSALWTPSRGTDRLCGVVVAEPDSHPGVGCTFPCTGAFRLVYRGPEVMVQRQLRPQPPPAPSRPTPQGRSGTGQGLCVLYDPRQAPPTVSRMSRHPKLSEVMRQHSGVRVRPGGLRYDRVRWQLGGLTEGLGGVL